MRAVLLQQSNTPLVLLNDQPEPDPGDGIVLDVTACGICHSDIHVADGDFGKEPPIILGHEFTPKAEWSWTSLETDPQQSASHRRRKVRHKIRIRK